MAPEIIKLLEGENYSNKCDLWSLGIILYELCFKEAPFKGKTEFSVLKQINSIGNNILKKKDKTTGDEKLDDLINKLLEKEPEKRISWNEYFKHPFFNINENEITITHKNNNNENKIRIFGEDFINNNKNKCKIKYEEKEYELQEYFEIKTEELVLKLLDINNITDISKMFYECEYLQSIPDISKWNTNNVINISYMFSYCKTIESLPDISK